MSADAAREMEQWLDDLVQEQFLAKWAQDKAARRAARIARLRALVPSEAAVLATLVVLAALLIVVTIVRIAAGGGIVAAGLLVVAVVVAFAAWVDGARR